MFLIELTTLLTSSPPPFPPFPPPTEFPFWLAWEQLPPVHSESVVKYIINIIV
jgi:hypothetical protein